MDNWPNADDDELTFYRKMLAMAQEAVKAAEAEAAMCLQQINRIKREECRLAKRAAKATAAEGG